MCASAAVYFKITNRTLHTLKKLRHFKTAIAPEQKILPTSTVAGIERGINSSYLRKPYIFTVERGHFVTVPNSYW
jgi:hypothetical protein